MTFNDRIRKALEKSCDSVFSIGESVLGAPVYCGKKGDGNRSVIVTGGIHARERYTAFAVTRQAEEYAPESGRCAYFIPLVNPDGAAFCENETDGGKMYEYKSERAFFKANANLVDLNVNFPAEWGTGCSNVFEPSPANYVGRYPLSEPETSALADFTRKVRPICTLSYHAAGREIYWEFGQTGEFKKRCKKIASALCDKLGYKRVDGANGSAGGYKDFCVQSLEIPAFTIEIADGVHPLKLSDFSEDIERNADLVGYLFRLLNEYV